MRLKAGSHEAFGGSIGPKRNPIVVYGLLGLLLILGALGLEAFAGKQQDLKSQLETRQNELATLNSIKNTDVWSSRLEQSLALKKNAEAKVWRGNTSGVIAAELQQSLRRISRAHDVKNVNINVDPEPSTVEGVDILRFEYTGRIASGKDTIDFFAEIASHDKAISLIELSLTNSIRDKRPTYLTMSGSIPIIVTIAETGAN